LGELRRIFPEASKKMLTQHLREMEKDGLVIRKDLSGRLRHVEYFLSDPLGFAAVQLIDTLTRWGREYLPYGPSTPGVGQTVIPAPGSGVCGKESAKGGSSHDCQIGH
jgi:DNA-binding HxlR family transcriptional regulator